MACLERTRRPRIETLLGAMTLEEKIGQMTLVSAGQAVTGPGGPVDYMQAIRTGAGRHGQQSVGPRADARGAARRARGDPPSAFRCSSSWTSSTATAPIFPLPLAEVGGFDPELVGAHGAGRGRGGGRRRPRHDLRADAGRGARPALGPDRREPRRGSVARRALRPRQGRAASRAAISRPPTAWPPPPSIWPPMARSPPAANTPRSTSRSARCTRSTCRRSGRRSRPASPRSCRPSTTSPACR